MSIREDLRIPLTMLSTHYLDKLKFKGSYNGRRFQFEKVIIKNENENGPNKAILRLYIWKDLFNFENTDKKDMIVKDFDFTDDGISKGIDFVEETKI